MVPLPDGAAPVYVRQLRVLLAPGQSIPDDLIPTCNSWFKLYQATRGWVWGWPSCGHTPLLARQPSAAVRRWQQPGWPSDHPMDSKKDERGIDPVRSPAKRLRTGWPSPAYAMDILDPCCQFLGRRPFGVRQSHRQAPEDKDNSARQGDGVEGQGRGTTEPEHLSTPQLYPRAGCRVRSPERQGPGTASRRCTKSVGCGHVPVPSAIPRDPAAPSTGRLGPGNGQRPPIEDG